MTASTLSGPARRAGARDLASDGRRRRSDASRRAIVEAMLELVREGDPSPSAEQVAARAGVGRRTVFRLFSDMDGLYREMHGVIRARVAPIRTLPLPPGPAAARLLALAERRSVFFEDVLPLWEAGALYRSRSEALRQEQARMQAELRSILLEVCPEELRADGELVELLDAVLSIDLWRRLRRDQGLAPGEARALVVRLVAAIVPPDPGA